MNHFDGEQFLRDLRVSRLDIRRWSVRLMPWGWTVISPRGWAAMVRGYSRTEWRQCLTYATEQAKAGHR